MSTTIPPAVEDALRFLRAYVPDTIVDNWRVVGTTVVMVGLCLCPIIGSAWDGAKCSVNSADEDEYEQLHSS